MTPLARTRTRLVLRDLAAAAAFASIAVSGSVPWWALATFSIALALALLRRRILSDRTGWAAATLGTAAVLLFGLVFRGGLDLVIAACVFAALITASRMLAAPSPATDSQVHLTSLLMVAGGAALSGELLFAVCLAAFAVLVCLSLGLGVLETTSAPDEVLIVRPALRRIGLGTAVAIVGGLLFFLAFPRLSWNLASRRLSPGLGAATSGFSDRVRLGGGGTIKTNPRIVLRATLQPDPRFDQLDAYWIGRTFEAFTGKEWTGQGVARPPSTMVTLGPSAKSLVHQKIELLPAYDSRTLVALEPPVLVGNAVVHNQSGSGRTSLTHVQGEEVHFTERGVGYAYHAYSLPSEATPAQAEPIDRDRFLGLPADLDPRIAELAVQVVGGEPDPLEAARKLAAHLRQSYGYTLELPGDVEQPLADFLFNRKEGHCEHFATALTVMLRTQGFPARVAAGFFGGERINGYYVVRAGDAHAWTQVWVPRRGFVSVDATPSSRRAGQPLPVLEWLVRIYESVEALWRERVIDYSLQDQFELARALVRPPRDLSERGPQPSIPRRVWIGAASVALLGYAAWRFGRRRTRRARPHPASSLLDEIDQALATSKVERLKGEPLEELTARLLEQGHPVAPPLAKISRRYLEARFGSRPIEAAERAAFKVRLKQLRR